MCRLRTVVMFAVPLVLVTASLAQTTTDQATKIPWSASYYPQMVGALFNGYLPGEAAPLAKYDEYTGQGTNAAAWEKAHRSQNVPGWFGYCHAWSAASIMVDEPQFSRYGKGVVFRVGDLKGILMPLYYVTLATGVGERCWAAPGSCKPNDPTPIEFEAFLLKYISGQATGTKTAIVMDKNSGEQVWNQPLYKYTRTEQKAPTSSGWIKKVTMTVEYVLEFSDYDQAGTTTATETYYYSLEDTDDDNKADKSQWTDAAWTQPSENHPDFLWYPTMIYAGTDPNINPYVKQSDVATVLGLPKVGLLVRDNDLDKGIEPSGAYAWHSPDLWIQPAQPQPGQAVTLSAKVHNESGLDLNGATVRFYRSAPNLGSMDPSLLGQYKVGEVANVAIGHYQNTDVSLNWKTPTNATNGDGCILVSTDHPQDPLKKYYPSEDNNVAARNFFSTTLAANLSSLDFPIVLLNPNRQPLRASLSIALDRGGPGWTVVLVDGAGRAIAEKHLDAQSPVPLKDLLLRARNDNRYRLRIHPPENRRVGDSAQISVRSRLVSSDDRRKPEMNGITLTVDVVAP